ncbi:hypothetical protein D1818_14390 [Aquimarina sp. BL5]|uniref:polysaccharide pyruvyl transferase family protein n=1 Tax=Aquimarina sp. BL5 TaxID=1714860 RepID=UPI000E4C6917|nr:polysaccharide pyruvyl transferase family protein [Aquimarina sp. BL5]AXT51975.1 hypothetical protein D1818_14390 [Aquimarina sp. BL5]RKN03244.1 hypothetical protein D7036_14395 [Aquimarina sp. BL5]
MKNIHTITFHHVLNYGAVLQAYALAKFLKQEGYEVEVLDYRPSYFMFQTYRPAKGLLKTINKAKKNIRFYKFRRDFLPLSKNTFFSVFKLKKKFANSNDYFICGSDQVWNANLTKDKIDKGYFLDFLPKKAIKISYAASMGNTGFDANHTEAKEVLSSFHKILVREDFAQNEINKISNNTIDSSIVVDPTLLLNNYNEILDFSLVPNEPYLVSYLTENSKEVKEYIRKVVKMTGLPLINLGHHYIEDAQKNYLYESPSKWLGVFSKATMVCTNSFHGNAYSLIFKRNFTVFSRSTKKELNRRQLTLLENLGLEHRFIYKIDDLKEEHLKDIDYNKVNPKYDTLVNKSKKLLIDAIENLDSKEV